MRDKIFVSYRDDIEGRTHKNLLVAWSENKSFPEVSFYDNSVGTSINSKDAYYIKYVISNRIANSNIFLCLIGEHTHKSEWVAWEIEQAKELKKRIIAVKISKNYNTPINLYGVGASWALDFSKSSILNAMKY